MIGFDAEAVHHEFGLLEDDGLLAFVRRAVRQGNRSQKPYRPAADVLDLVSFR
jgi:hypothetical protein